MNRCSPLRLRRPLTGLWLAAMLAVAAGSALAQSGIRTFPESAIRATMVVVQPPGIRMDGRDMRLSPGSRIFGTSNTVIMSASLVGQELTVNYIPDPQGQVHQVWLLTAAEASQKRPRLGDQRNGRAPAAGDN